MSDTIPGTSIPSEDREALEALSRIDAALGSGGDDTLRSAAAADVCGTYRQIRPWLLTVLPWIRRIPVFGARIAVAIEFLMSIADAYCKP